MDAIMIFNIHLDWYMNRNGWEVYGQNPSKWDKVRMPTWTSWTWWPEGPISVLYSFMTVCYLTCWVFHIFYILSAHFMKLLYCFFTISTYFFISSRKPFHPLYKKLNVSRIATLYFISNKKYHAEEFISMVL